MLFGNCFLVNVVKYYQLYYITAQPIITLLKIYDKRLGNIQNIDIMKI